MALTNKLRNLILSKPFLRQRAIQTAVVGRKMVNSVHPPAFVKHQENGHLLGAYNLNRSFGPRPKLCYAPFSNLYLGSTGRVTSCCFNRHYLLGTYPDQSLDYIWNGSLRKALCSALDSGDLSKGCQSCGELIRDGNYSSVNAQTYDYFSAASVPYPTRMDFELSNTCNLSCTMCNGYCSSTIRKEVEKNTPLHSPYDADFLRQLEPFLPHLQYAKFLGGEPFLIPLYFRIWERLSLCNPDVQLYVQTNGTQYNSRVEEVLRKGLFSIGVSIDSLQKPVFEQIRRKAKYEEVLENIPLFSRYCLKFGTRFSLSVCPMRSNLDELPDIVAFADELGAQLYFNVVYEPHVLAVWTLPADELRDYASDLEIRSHKLPETPNRRVLMDFIHQLHSWANEAEERISYKDSLLQLSPEDLIVLFSNRLGSVLNQSDYPDIGNLTQALQKELQRGMDHLLELLSYPSQRILNHLQLQGQVSHGNSF